MFMIQLHLHAKRFRLEENFRETFFSYCKLEEIELAGEGAELVVNVLKTGSVFGKSHSQVGSG